MKNIFILIVLLLSNNLLAQHFEKKTDDFTGNKIIECSTYKQNAVIASTISKEYTTFLKCYAEISPNGNKVNYLKIEIATPNIFCFSKDNGKAIFLTDDGRNITLRQVSKLNCETTQTITYELHDSNMTDFVNSTIKKIRITSTDGYFDLTIKDKKKQLIKDTFIMFNMNIQ